WVKGLLHGQGIRDARPLKPSFLSDLDKLRTGDGRALPPRLRDEIRREHERLLLVCKQIKTLEAENIAAHSTPAKGSVEAKAVQLAQLQAIGPQIAQVLANEVFYRDFRNRRQVGRCVGLTDTPYDSGASRRQSERRSKFCSQGLTDGCRSGYLRFSCRDVDASRGMLTHLAPRHLS
ncbi:transposase, partial [Bradyrhizobium sp. 143]|uniref:transposase n=1 Tax=Bradyrhizobium sp. 143 TaxID=2782619 RepID=UPI001FF786B8